MECALETGISKVLQVSTVAVWGKPDISPIVEETPVGPVRFSEYSKTKYEGELRTWKLYEGKGLPLVMIYPCGVLGPNDLKPSGRLILNIINQKMPARVFDDSVMTWVDVRDVAEAIVRALEKENNLGEKYIVGKHQLSMGELYEMVSEISGVPLPKLRMPDSIALFNAALLTWFANLTKRPPAWEMAWDAMRMVKEGFRANGAKAERELGIAYTPIRVTLEQVIASYQEGPSQTP
jgi:dihydroflavonol-4-reductase